MVAFSEMGSPALVDGTSASVLAPTINPSAAIPPPTFQAAPTGTSLLIALLVEMRVANELTAYSLGASAPNLVQLRADALWDLTPPTGAL